MKKVIFTIKEVLHHKKIVEISDEDYERLKKAGQFSVDDEISEYMNGRLTTEDGEWEDGEMDLCRAE